MSEMAAQASMMFVLKRSDVPVFHQRSPRGPSNKLGLLCPWWCIIAPLLIHKVQAQRFFGRFTETSGRSVGLICMACDGSQGLWGSGMAETGVGC